MKIDLEKKVVLVTDSDSDNASGIITVLKREGATVISCVPQGQAAPAGAEAVYSYDLSDYDQAVALRDEINARYGRLDAIVFHRFDVRKTSILTQDITEYIGRMNAPRAAFVCCKVLAQYMADLGNGGAVVFITTLHDEKPNGADFVHSVTQGMIENLVMEASLQYGPQGVRVVQISRGPKTGEDEVFRNDLTNFNEGTQYKTPLSRLVSVDDIANMTAFLVSDLGGFVNGTRIRLDGGLTNEYIDPKANARALAKREVR